MGNTASGLDFSGTIFDYEDFDPEEDAKALHKAFHSKFTVNNQLLYALWPKAHYV